MPTRTPSPARVGAHRLKLRRDLATAITERIRRQALTQVQCAAILGISQPRLNGLLKGRIELFSLDTLVELAERSGLNVAIRVTRPYTIKE